MLDLRRDSLGVVSRRVRSLPGYIGDEAGGAEDFVTHELQVRLLVVVDADEDCAGRREQLAQELQARVHHAQPLVVAGEVLALLAHDLPEPFPDARVVHVVVVDPALVAGVVRRIDVDAVDLSLVFRKQRLQRFEVVAVDDHVSAVGAMAVQHALLGDALEYAIRHVPMVVDDLFLAHPVQCRHKRTRPFHLKQ